MLAEQRSADNNPIPDRAERLIYWIPRSRLSEDFAQFCLSGSLTVPLATLSAGRQASHFFLYCTYFYFSRIFWLVSNSLARTSFSGLSVCVSMSVCSQQGLGGGSVNHLSKAVGPYSVSLELYVYWYIDSY